MRTHTMTHDAAEALIRGAAPADRSDLAPLALAIAEFRGAAYATPPRPSAELGARLELAGASEISFAAVPTRSSAATVRHDLTATRSPALGGVRRALGWFAGLGIAAQVVVGVSVAAAVGVTGVGTVAGVSSIVAAITQNSDNPAPGERDDPALEPGGSVVPAEQRVDDDPATTTDDSATPSPAADDDSAPQDPTTTPVEPAPSESTPGNSGNPGSGNNADSGSNGVGNPGTGNNGNSGSNGNAGNKSNPGNNGHHGDNGNSGNSGNGNKNKDD